MRGFEEALADRPDVAEAQVTARAEPQGLDRGAAHERARDVRLHDRTAVRQRRVRDRELERRHREISLADREVDRLPLVPRLVVGRPQPARRRHDAARLAGQVDPRPVSQPEPVRPLLHRERAGRLLVKVEAVAEAVEPRVARLRERRVQRHVCERTGLDVVEREVADREGAAAEERRVRRDQPRAQRRLGDDRLEGRAGRIEALRSAIEQLAASASRQELLQVRRAARRRDLAVGGIARERVEAAGPWVDHHRCAGVGVGMHVPVGEGDPVLDHLLGDALQPCVDRQLQRRQLLAGHRNAQRAHHPSERVDLHTRLLEAAVEPAVVPRLDPGLADDLPALRARVAGRAELRRADLAEQPEELAAERALRIAPDRERGDVHARQQCGVLVEEEGHGPRRVREDDGGRERRADERRPDAADHQRGADPARDAAEPGECLASLGRRRPAAVPVDAAERVGIDGDDGVAVRPGEQPSPRVDDRAARGRQVDRPERLAQRDLAVARALQHLQRPQPQSE